MRFPLLLLVLAATVPACDLDASAGATTVDAAASPVATSGALGDGRGPPHTHHCGHGGCPDLAPAPGRAGVPALTLAQLVPGRGITLFDTTDADIALAGSAYSLCSSIGCIPLEVLAPETAVPAHGYAVVPWPSGLLGTAERGEAALFFAPSALGLRMDAYVCWGEGPETSRQREATLVQARWTGPCAPSLARGSIERLCGSTGADAESYDVRARAWLRACAP